MQYEAVCFMCSCASCAQSICLQRSNYNALQLSLAIRLLACRIRGGVHVKTTAGNPRKSDALLSGSIQHVWLGGRKGKKKCTVNASDISRITINQTEKNEQAVITLRHLRLISIFKKN